MEKGHKYRTSYTSLCEKFPFSGRIVPTDNLVTSRVKILKPRGIFHLQFIGWSTIDSVILIFNYTLFKTQAESSRCQ